MTILCIITFLNLTMLCCASIEYQKTFMDIRSWQQKIIDDFPSIVEENRRFILKAPTGAGKTFLASELIKRFYSQESDEQLTGEKQTQSNNENNEENKSN